MTVNLNFKIKTYVYVSGGGSKWKEKEWKPFILCVYFQHIFSSKKDAGILEEDNLNGKYIYIEWERVEPSNMVLIQGRPRKKWTK